jgi:pimeloyl-ACP methyl ester carboxylesterase
MTSLNFFTDAGQGEPAIVFVHGFTCDHTDWDEQTAPLSRNHRCVAVDLPGHGASPQSAPDVTALAQAVVETIRTAGISKAVLVGHSMGCRVISAAYRAAPELIGGLIYVDGSMLPPGDPETAMRNMDQHIVSAGWDAFLEKAYEGFFIASSPQAVRNRVCQRRPLIDPVFHRRLAVNLAGWDAGQLRETLRTIRVPVLAIQSTMLDSHLRHVAIQPGLDTLWMKALKEDVPGARLEIVLDSGHFTMLEAPERTTALIASFLEELRLKGA